MEVRKLNKNDVTEFRSLRLLSLQTDAQVFASLYDVERNYPLSKFEQRLESNDTKFTVGGFEDAKLVCTATFYRETVKKLQHKGNLVAMYCHPKYRGNGIAESVVNKLLQDASELSGLKMIDLSVLTNNNRAVDFYRKMGFEKYATEPMAIFDGTDYYDEVMMRFEITTN
ncbi:GNAT family N-acetyltransferase [Mammaliicoccus vitulinus]|uniref:GNAT family N-acetyltransferase n=1 Tax=Mammaliicoccus vitulinus TaxID=71237 RepID=UPI000D1D1DCB|nr:GNAT family N-acetyltransferase [Mammaliicoccus vitulinus]PTI86148.1 GNAT family N-acetyltransferase [Mammaliicoccus vitulinus]QQT15628.1 GNAT family N-acetyltransferase [Mammaliicoccus vitulinus]QQY19072.1 GNAT family N-acetyltransferase [Mammaliicoccus vitulinus]RIN21682.1 GNAT family N-acetyltransferase [Mammaliicoccus vitulinus]RTX89788.1 GNAT family N-acetyltransferase [Mammaliicoccus vitulinus]